MLNFRIIFLLFLLQTWFESNAKRLPCIRISKCPHINELKITKRNDYGFIYLLNILHCEPRNQEIYIKCLSEQKVLDFMKRAELIPNSDYCGVEPPVPKISGGKNTGFEDFPWIALLQYGSNNTLNYGCHGSLIAKRYVVTAAHCVDSLLTEKKGLGKLNSVVLGDYNIVTERDCIQYKTNLDCVEENKKNVPIESIHVHPEYNPKNHFNDIALIRLNQEVEYNEFIKPVCLPPLHLISPFNETLLIAGWGKTDTNEKNKVKVKASMELHRCRVSSSLTQKHYCAIPKGGAKTCPGDSGGPLMMRRLINNNPTLYLIGIDSLGVECTISGNPIAIYTRVAPYIGWILETIHN